MAPLLILLWIIAADESISLLFASPQEELGKWWKNSGIVQELQLTEEQVSQIEQSFLKHRAGLMPLIDELKRHEERLSMLMRAESLKDDDILAQAELVAIARAELEKENASMMLSIRKALTGRQWNRLAEIQDLRNTSSALILQEIPATGASGTSVVMSASTRADKKVYSIKDGIKPPQILYQPLPPYTQEAREARAEGTILLEVIIRKDGSVDSLKVLEAVGYGLDESAIRTVAKEWRFSPGSLNGRPVDVQANIEISFRLY